MIDFFSFFLSYLLAPSESKNRSFFRLASKLLEASSAKVMRASEEISTNEPFSTVKVGS